MVTLADQRARFPALQTKHYFNYGGQGPLPQPALEAITNAFAWSQVLGPFSGQALEWIAKQEVANRSALATELGVAPQTLTLTESTTTGCNIVLWGLPWQPGDHILIGDGEHPGVVAAVQQTAGRLGLQINTCPLTLAPDPLAVIDAHLTPQTRLLVISHVLWHTGQVLPLADILQLCHGRPQPVWVLVDAAQSVGVLPLDLAALGVDFYALTGHKWWCGPDGLGALYTRPDLMDVLEPTYVGWRGVEAGNPRRDGRRYEVATSAFALGQGLRVALEVHAQWGTPTARYQRQLQMSSLLWETLSALPDVTCLLPSRPAAGLVAFRKRGVTPVQLVRTLEDQGFCLRTIPQADCVRASVHYLTSDLEIEALAAAIEAT